MRLIINGETRTFAEMSDIAALVAALKLDPRKVAVERNLEIVPRSTYGQVALSVDVESDYRLRGYSLSDGRPTATAQIAYDHGSGLYAGASATAVFDPGGPDLLGGEANIGYARRLGSQASLDVGMTRWDFSASSSVGHATHYTEAYVGLAQYRHLEDDPDE